MQQAAILAYFREAARHTLGPPTLRELCAHFGWSSTGTARDHLRALVNKGALRREHGRRARAYALADEPPRAVAVPVLGQVPAGRPAFAEENLRGEAAVPASWVSGQGCFAVAVTGDSMTGAGILSGDLVVAHPSDVAKNGDIVIARCRDEATVKRFEQHGSRMRLMPDNPDYDPAPIEADTRVVGIVVGLLRDMRPRKLGQR